MNFSLLFWTGFRIGLIHNHLSLMVCCWIVQADMRQQPVDFFVRRQVGTHG